MEPEKRPGWTEIIESLSEELESHPPGEGPRFYRRMKVGIPKAENQTTIVASLSSSSASPVSLGMQASSSRMESLPNSEHQTPGSFSSTGLLKMQQQGTGPVKSQALPIIWEEDYNFAEWEKTSVWRELLQGHDIPNGEAALKALMPREVARALEDIAAVEVNATSRSREAIAAWYAAMESWVPLTPAASEAWQEIQGVFTLDNGSTIVFPWVSTLKLLDAWRKERLLDAWHKESRVEFQVWKEAMKEAGRQNTVLKTLKAAFSEIDKVLDLRISPPVKVGSGWEADMNFKLLNDFHSLLKTAESKAFAKAATLQKLFRNAELYLPFFPSRKLIREIYSEDD
jgi:hypothetical protein